MSNPGCFLETSMVLVKSKRFISTKEITHLKTLGNKQAKLTHPSFQRRNSFLLLQMITTSISVYFLVLFFVHFKILALADENQFIYNGFHGANLHLEGLAEIHSNGLLQLTNTAKIATGHAFYKVPVRFNTSSSGLPQTLSFSTNFIFAIVPDIPNLSGHGIAFIISPSMDFTQATATQYLGILNSSNNGLTSNHLLAIEFDTVKSPDFLDINENHVGIDVNDLISFASAPVTYSSNHGRSNTSLELISGKRIQVWIDYDEVESLLNVTLAPIRIPKPEQPLLSTHIDLSPILLDSMYVGFSAATGALASNHYILGWSFNKSGKAQSLQLSNLPSLPQQRKWTEKLIKVSLILVSIVIAIAVAATIYFVRRKRKQFEELYEDWEQEYGPHRFSYKDLYKATKGFQDKELIGAGGFGKVYRGVLPSSKEKVAVKKISQDSKQGIKEFVAEIASMGRLRHRNLMQLLGYCRRKGELLLVYDYMPNQSLDKFLFSNEKPNLDWAQRFRIIKGVASALTYLHEECEQVVLHRDVKASNVLLDADLNGRLGDFGLARLYDHGANPHTTNVVGTIGYIAPELTRTGKATTSTDVFAFGAFSLEVACGRNPVEVRGLAEEMILVDWVFARWKQGGILETSDPRLGGDYVEEEMELVLKQGLLCSHANPAARPSMRQVMQYLDGVSFLPEMLPTDDIEAPAEFDMSPPSSSGNVSAHSASTNESILSRGFQIKEV